MAKMDVLHCVRVMSSDDRRHDYTICRERKKDSLWLTCTPVLRMFETIELEILPLLEELPREIGDDIDRLTAHFFTKSAVIELVDFMRAENPSTDKDVILDVLEDVIHLYIRSRLHRHLKDYNLQLHRTRQASLRARLMLKAGERKKKAE